LKDHEIAGLVTYIRQNWGSEASGISEEEVAAIRAEIGGRASYTADELKEYFQ
jgi:mono/diheme cytochrome c family protein